MNKKNGLRFILGMTILIVVLLVALTGCGGTSSNAGNTGIGFVTSSGGINDKSFNQSTWEGVQRYASDNGLTADYIESKEASQLEQNLNASAMSHEVVVAAGFDFANPLYHSALANPDTDYVLIDAEPTNDDGEVVTMDNVESFLFTEEESGYLVGYVAGKTTATDKIGFIGGFDAPTVTPFYDGYVEGAKVANPNIEVELYYANSFDDVSKGKTASATMYSKGVDIIFTAAGGVNAGVIETAKGEREKGNEVWVIGVDTDMYDEGLQNDGSSIILTSAMKRVDEGAYQGLSDHYNGVFEGKTTRLDYSKGGVSLPEVNPNVDNALVEEAYKSLESVE